MSSDPWVKFYPSDWLSGTRGLTMAEAGLYITLIAMMYERAVPIDMEPGRLARLCGSSPAAFKRALEALIDQQKIIQTEAGLWSKRVEKELKLRSQRADLASKSARARWEKPQQKQTSSNADASKTQCESDATRSQKPDTPRKPPRGRRSYSDRFEAWWKQYPRTLNASKERASALFEKLSETDKQLAEQALGAFRRSVAGEEERFIPHPTTWLNQRRFETVAQPEAEAGPEAWERRVRTFAATGRWPDDAGPRPGQPGCKAPDEVETRHGYTPRPLARLAGSEAA